MSPRHAKQLSVAEMRDAICDRVDINENGCWIWRGAKQKGYGAFQWGGRTAPMQRAHRAAYLLWKGPIPPGLEVLHECDVRACCNPRHLSVGTHADNMADMKRKGRSGANPRRGSAQWNANITNEIALAVYSAPGRNVDIAAQFGIAPNRVSDIKRGIRWAHVTHLQEVPAT